MKLKYVNGMKVRNTIDADFGVIGSNKIYPYIPKNEIWFDKKYMREKEHFLKIHLFELKLMKRMGYEPARKIIEKKFTPKLKKGEIPNFVIRKRRYGGFIVKYVDGRIIRKFLDPKFILGAHWIETSRFAFAQSPSFSSRESRSNLDGAQEPEHAPDFSLRVLDSKEIAKKEIWIDICQDKREYNYSLIHEYKEALLMIDGMSYNDAHDYALAAEKAARRKDGARYLRD